MKRITTRIPVLLLITLALCVATYIGLTNHLIILSGVLLFSWAFRAAMIANYLEINKRKNENHIVMEGSKIYDELLEMAAIGSKSTGVKNVVIWAGPHPPDYGMRIRVSNVANKADADTFCITIPDLQVVGKMNENLMTPNILEQIKKWILLNRRVIEQYSNREILTEEFLARLIKPGDV